MSPNPDLLRVEFLGLTVRHDLAELPREDLALFFASISDRYALSRLEYHTDGGATFSSDDGGEFVLRPSQTASCAVTGLGYREGLERVVGLLEEAVERYALGQLWIEDVTMVGVWDVEDAEVVHELLAGSVLQIDAERLDMLGGDDVAVGLRIWRQAGEAVMECAVEPMHSEPSKLYIRLVHTQGDALAEASALREVADGVHGFLLGPLTSFILARARS
jgi:hypothetical protein